jgi:hypothetical protein
LHARFFVQKSTFHFFKQTLTEKFQEAGDKKVDGSFRFTVTNDQGNTKSWTVDFKNSPPYIGTENTDKVDVELVLKGGGF